MFFHIYHRGLFNRTRGVSKCARARAAHDGASAAISYRVLAAIENGRESERLKVGFTKRYRISELHVMFTIMGY